MELKDIIMIMLLHYLADFSLQTDEQAKAKSTDSNQLSYHILSYSLIMGIGMACVFDDVTKGVIFFMATYVCHFCTDYCTSRIGKYYWDKQDTHNGFNVVGFDQILHYIQLFTTFILLK